MSFDMQTTGLQLRSLVKASGELELSLARVPVQPPGPGEVLVRVEGSPINPSDLGLLVSAADMSQAKASGTAESPVLTASIPAPYMKVVAARLDESMPVGNEGAGVVVAAGEGAEGLMGKTVAMLGGAMYAQYRTVRAADVLLLPDDVTPAEGASCFVNPLTALGMVETMRREGHTALVHTAAASNLGQMLNRLCLKDGVQLVNIVRSAEQSALLKDQGAVHVLDSTSPTFGEDLTEALVTTGATLAFDAIGGGRLVGQIMTAMEVAANRKATEYSRYGSTTYKQTYIYGGLDTRPTELNRGFGMSWGVGGWLLTPFLQKIGPEAAQALRQRVASELKSTFASHYTAEISLAEALQPDILAAYNRRATGEKYLINPNKGV
ncbi:zinc-binding dehydrogenase [Phenylobacterium sp.]|uniref:zinc-binding dehydrogenase n=1 Tax=Phenylobacterium sp. TaxID=1871053 RepID=UPI0027321A52|nr:zinc-binding dehydrogenase [Phenylobacterium sp.]MDP1875731.1 zinc-binding dehydrogenase [Phenylobacterium sp.]